MKLEVWNSEVSTLLPTLYFIFLFFFIQIQSLSLILNNNTNSLSLCNWKQNNKASKVIIKEDIYPSIEENDLIDIKEFHVNYLIINYDIAMFIFNIHYCIIIIDIIIFSDKWKTIFIFDEIYCSLQNALFCYVIYFLLLRMLFVVMILIYKL